MLASCVVAFDHVRRTMSVIGPADEAERVLAALATPAAHPAGRATRRRRAGARDQPRALPWRRSAEAKEHIAAGDAFQILMSQRVRRSDRASRRSPSTGRCARSTRRRTCSCSTSAATSWSAPRRRRTCGSTWTARASCGRSPAPGRAAPTAREDDRLAEELMASPKERAEHVMLVDLGRNDLSRVCEPGSVRVERYMEVERYSHVMHIVSRVFGQIRPDRDAAALLRATFPAGTVSGAPKVRAMQIIAELEGRRRGAYAGAVGYLGFGGDMDTCIAIRTIVMRDGDGLSAGGRRDRGRLRPGGGARGVHQQDGGAADARSTRRRRGSTGRESACDRQLRLVHLQPGGLHRVRRRGGAGRAQRRDRARRGRGLVADPRGRLPGPGHAGRGGRLGGRDRAAGRARARARRLPRPPGDRRHVRRRGRPGEPADARQVRHGHARRLAAVRRHPQPVRGRPLPLAGGARACPTCWRSPRGRPTAR